MSNNTEVSFGKESPELQHIRASIERLAEESRGDALELLSLLRFLENLHREISEGIFQESLPSNRQALYALLKDIEANGGWPYIYRMRLQAFLKNLESDENSSDRAESSS